MAAIMLIAVVSCSRHEDLPDPLPLVTPPMPSLTVSTPDSMTFNLSWTVSDPTVVNYYRIYTIIPLIGTQIDTTSATNAVVGPLGTVFPGLTFGVSSVTFQNVESVIDFKPAIP